MNLIRISLNFSSSLLPPPLPSSCSSSPLPFFSYSSPIPSSSLLSLPPPLAPPPQVKLDTYLDLICVLDSCVPYSKCSHISRQNQCQQANISECSQCCDLFWVPLCVRPPLGFGRELVCKYSLMSSVVRANKSFLPKLAAS